MAEHTQLNRLTSPARRDGRCDDAWLKVLADTSMDLSERLQVASTEESINEWFKSVVLEGASHYRGVRPEQLRVLLEASPDPVLSELYRGAEALLSTLEELGPEVDLELHAIEDFELGASLTDPTVPAILGDEWASFVEGLVAGFGAALLQSTDPELTLELMTVFADRMQRYPRLLALAALAGSVHLRGDWRRHLSKEDIDTFERDTRLVDRYVSRLEELVRIAPCRS